MKRSDRKLLRTMVDAFQASDGREWKNEEGKHVQRLISIALVNPDAFHDLTTINSKTRRFLQSTMDYPLTFLGQEQLDKNWYDRLSENTVFRVLRDTAAAAGFVLGVVFAYLSATG